jgi:tetratricopeptide (TPR) repeat protein
LPESDLSALLQRGMFLHQNGELTGAEQIYQDVLRRRPNHFDALRLLGLIALQTRRAALAVDLLGQAVALNRDDATVHASLGSALRGLGRLDDALASYDRAIALLPDYADAYGNRGNVLRDLRRLEEAVASYATAIALKPDHAAAYLNRGHALRDLKRPDEAIASYDHAIALRPDDSEAHYHRGLACRQARRPGEAVASYDKAIALRPTYAEAYNNRGNALSDLRRPEQAIASYDQAISLRPDYPEAHANRAVALEASRRLATAAAHYNRATELAGLGRHAEALRSFELTIELMPEHADAHIGRGNMLFAQGHHAKALASFEATIALVPDSATAHSNRGNALRALNRPEEAIAAHDRAIALSPDYAEAHNNRGNALCELLRYREALESYTRAIALRPDYAEAHLNLSFCLLRTGGFDVGWREYEWRKKLDQPIGARSFARPLWLGADDIAGKTILIHAEQGYGDAIQFCRYAKLLEARGAKVILQVRQRVSELLSTFSPGIRVITQQQTPDEFHYHCPMLSLPLAFGTTLETIPAEPRYLRCEAGRLAVWSARLGPRAKPRVGVVWSGRTGQKSDHKRSMPLTSLLPLFGLNLDFVCLQKEVSADELALLQRSGIACFADEQNDFADAAALIELMDLVITVDTSVAHVAGALGKPVWILLSYNPDWRWLLDRTDSPWYPSARLFRQPRIGDWDGVVADVERCLRRPATPSPCELPATPAADSPAFPVR